MINKKKKYDIILFDVDDTLMDFRISERNALHNTFMEFNLPNGFSDYHDSYRAISKILWNELEQGKLALGNLGVERFNRLFKQHGIAVDASLFSQSYLGYLGKETHLMPGAVDLCSSLEQCRLAIITNGFGHVQKARIENSPLKDLFEQVVISEETGFQKPDSGIFDYTFSKMGIKDKNRVLIVGDSLTSDIKGGSDYSIDTCWFNPHQKSNGTEVIPTYEIRELAELSDIVNGHPLKG
ncbi:YjjG family noncanonical pyrimidine nucleotidase [Planococcus salinus]|uniref:Noncanonical pyrimidine nucleotidase, YjjG family n=1 Tax=Planococcus salinus TaxID=1848460 RepID=A0A3M8P9Q6_9BACL|nr:YjjG family noncanonical pyrimidine nucleotidase [Planococcus salinus]RNF40419.1 noncanonical pyrimidine nucleotidase, YjjG family [Planococcus salinus]